MLGSLRVLSTFVTKSFFTEFLGIMAASTDVLVLAKVEVELPSISEGRIVILKRRGRPVFIHHRTTDEIVVARSVSWKTTVILRVTILGQRSQSGWSCWCLHSLGHVLIGEAGDFGGWCVSFNAHPPVRSLLSFPQILPVPWFPPRYLCGEVLSLNL